MPARKEVVTIPVRLMHDPRVVKLSAALSLDGEEVPYNDVLGFVMHMLFRIAASNGDATGLAFGPYDTPQNRRFVELMVDNGRCGLYDDYNAARDKHRERCRGVASQYRGKKVAPKVREKAPVVASGFDVAWKKYPKRSGGNPRALAAKAWAARVREGVPDEELATATANYAAHCDAEKKSGTPYVMQGGTFYGPSQRWKDFLVAPVDTEMDEIMAEIRQNFTED